MTVATEALELHQPAILTNDLSVSRTPAVVLEEAQKAAQALRDVISQKAKPVILNGEQYLEFEDWMLVGRFYGVTAEVVETQEIQIGDVVGFKAKAKVILVATGTVISGAEAMCLNDEPKWSSRPKYEWKTNEETGRRERVCVGEEPVPLFQLLSMAQTRACAKALRNVMSWVVVLAGYRPTPAEEMTGSEQQHDEPAPRRTAKPAVSRMPERKSAAGPAPTPSKPAPAGGGDTITEPQRKRFYAIWRGNGIPEDIVREHLKTFGYESSNQIRRSDYEDLCSWAQHFGQHDTETQPADYDDSVS